MVTTAWSQDCVNLELLTGAERGLQFSSVPYEASPDNQEGFCWHIKEVLDMAKHLIARVQAQESLKLYYYERAAERDRLKARVAELEGLLCPHRLSGCVDCIEQAKALMVFCDEGKP